jgi:hypothetical protein
MAGRTNFSTKCERCGIDLINVGHRRKFCSECYIVHEKEINGKRAKAYYENNTEEIKIYWDKRRIEKKEDFKVKDKQKHFKKKIKVLEHYSNGTMSCNCCGETFLPMLQIDHINNDGAEHSKKIGNSLYLWLIRNNFPLGFQVLCAVCNARKYWDFHKNKNGYIKS